MGAGKLVLFGAVAAGGLLLLMHHASASPASSSSPVPPPAPGPGATSTVGPSPMAVTGLSSIRQTSWHVSADASGQQAGTMMLVQNAANPNDWALVFSGDAGGRGVMAYGSTPMSGLLAQAIAAGQ